jgi:methionyl-tRNA synthetase
VGETIPARDVRLADATWRQAEKRILNAGPLWPRHDPQSGGPTSPPPSKQPSSIGATTVSESSNAPDAPAAPAAPVAPAPSAPAAPIAPVAPDDRISIDDFMKIDLRVAKVIEAERVPKSKKLVKMSVDVGTERRTILAGIAEAYEPEALVGKTVVIVANLKPAKLMGIESNGMVLAASPDGGLAIVVNAEPAVPGTRVR